MANSGSFGGFIAKRYAHSKHIQRLLDSLSDAQLETFEILADADQATDLLMSMMEVQQGHVVPFDLAFADL